MSDWNTLEDLDIYLSKHNRLNIEIWNDRRKFSLNERWNGQNVFGILLKHYFKFMKSETKKSEWKIYIDDIYDTHAESFHQYENYTEHIISLIDIMKYTNTEFLEKIILNEHFPILMKDHPEETIFRFFQSRPTRLFQKVKHSIYLLIERPEFQTQIYSSSQSYWESLSFMFSYFYCFEDYQLCDYFKDIFSSYIENSEYNTIVNEFIYCYDSFQKNDTDIFNLYAEYEDKFNEVVNNFPTKSIHKKNAVSVFIYTMIKTYEGNNQDYLDKIFGMIDYYMEMLQKRDISTMKEFYSFLNYFKYMDEYMFLYFLKRYENIFISYFEDSYHIKSKYFDEIQIQNKRISHQYITDKIVYNCDGIDIFYVWWNNLLVYACFEKKRMLVRYLIEHGQFENIKNKEHIYILFVYHLLSYQISLIYKYIYYSGTEEILVNIIDVFEDVILHMFKYIDFPYFFDDSEFDSWSEQPKLFHPIHISVSFRMKRCMKYIVENHICGIVRYIPCEMDILYSDFYMIKYEDIPYEYELRQFEMNEILTRSVYTDRFYDVDEKLYYYVLNKEQIEKTDVNEILEHLLVLFNRENHIYIRETFFVCICILYDWNDLLDSYFSILSKIRYRPIVMNEIERTIYHMHRRVIDSYEIMCRRNTETYLSELLERTNTPGNMIDFENSE